MKKKFFIAIGIVSLVASSMAVGAFAATNLQKIEAYLNKDLKVKVNGEVLAIKDSSGKPTYPITYNGTTYLPVRSIGDAVGLKVGFDSAENAVLLGEQTSGGQVSDAGKSRNNPAPIGTEVKQTVKGIIDDYDATIKVEQVVRGDEAWTMIQQANTFNDPPAEGYEYLLAKITVGITRNAKADAAVNINGVSFKLISSDGKEYDTAMAVPPDPQLDANLYVGASNTGWAVFQVKTDDANPLLTFGRNYDGTGGAWFKVN